MGRGTAQACGSCQSPPGTERARHLLRRVAMALRLSLAATTGRLVEEASPNWPVAGDRSSMPSTRKASICASRFILARICTTVPPSSASWTPWTIIPGKDSLRSQPHGTAATRLPGFIDRYHERIGMFHVKDAEFTLMPAAGSMADIKDGRSPRSLPLAGRWPGRFQEHLLAAHSVRFRRLGGTRVGMLPQGCRPGAAEGAPFIARHLIQRTDKAFDDFAGTGSDPQRNRRLLGLGDTN